MLYVHRFCVIFGQDDEYVPGLQQHIGKKKPNQIDSAT